MPRLPLILAALTGVALLVTTIVALAPLDRWNRPGGLGELVVGLCGACHDLAVAGVLAASRGSGWRILRYTCAAVRLYLGFVATLVLPNHTGSWGYIGGIAAIFVGFGFALAAWGGVEQRKPGSGRSRALD